MKQLPEKVVDRSHANYIDSAGSPLRHSPFSHVSRRHSHLRCFAEATLGLRDGTDLSTEADFAKEDGGVVDWPVVDARSKCARDRKIPGRLLHPNSSDDVEEYIEL